METLDLSLDIPGAPLNRCAYMPPIPIAKSPPRSPRPPSAVHEGLGPIDELKVRERVNMVIAQLRSDGAVIVPSNAVMLGDITAPAVGVNGKVAGNVRATGSIHVRVGAAVHGTVDCKHCVLIAGTVTTGSNGVAIRSDDWVVLASTAHIVGHIKCRSVFIYDGAKVLGTIQPIDE